MAISKHGNSNIGSGIERCRSFGFAERGRELVRRFECNRCHEGTGLAAAPLAKHRFACLEQIIRGSFPVSAEASRQACSWVAQGKSL